MAGERPDWEWFARATELVAGGELDRAEAAIGAALEAGHLWRASLLRAPALDPLRGRTGFESIHAEARRRVEARHLAPLVLTAMPARGPVAPLLLILHGARGNAVGELERWRPATELGWIVAAAQSSQPATEDGFCWDPPRERVWEDLRVIVTALPEHGRIVVAGFSQGAWVAIDAALRADIVVAGTVLMIAPFAGPDPGLAGGWRRLRISILIGKSDAYLAPVEKLARQLRDHGHHVYFETIPNLGHAYPDDFSERLPTLLKP